MTDGAIALFRAAGRIALACAVVSVAAQLLVAASPGSPGERAARAAGVLPPDDSAVPAALRADLVRRIERIHDLDGPLPARIAMTTARLARADLGRSWRTGEPIRGSLVSSLSRTVPLIGLALLVAIALGLAAAGAPLLVRRGAVAVVIAALIAIASVTPPVWLALISLRLSDGVGAPLLATLTLAVLPAAIVGRHAGAHLADSLASDWARAARARGLSERQLIVRYGSRELGAELAPLVGGLVGYLLGTAMVIETVFGIRGLGALLADAARAGDGPMVVATATACALIVAVASAAGRSLARACDPRLRPELG